MKRPRRTRRVYASRLWQRARWSALGRAGWRCERCDWPGFSSRRTRGLQVHHDRPLWKVAGIEDMTDRELVAAGVFDPAGLTVLCRPCHRAVHELEEKERRRRREPPGVARWRERLRRHSHQGVG